MIDPVTTGIIIAVMVTVINAIRDYKGTKESLQEIIKDLRTLREKLRDR